MGNNISQPTHNGPEEQRNLTNRGPRLADERQSKYSNSLRWKRRARVTAHTVDLRTVPISRDCVRPVVSSGTQWEDPCFPREMAMEKSSVEHSPYRWMRPREFCERPTLFNGRPRRHDIIQGQLGNCWMMATLAGIAEHIQPMIQIIASRTYDPMSSTHDGVFHCRLWHYGQWVDVFVDDCLPVTPNHGAPKGYSLIGARSLDHNVLWVALVEKALAKFHGSYHGIESRAREYGWRLLTGGVPSVLKQEIVQRLASDDMFKRLKTAIDGGCIVTCSRIVEGNRRHAYTVTGAQTHSTKGNIIRIRNPWGEEKDRISWLDKPERWKYGNNENPDDFACTNGEFWVMRGECYRHFKEFCIGCFKAEFYNEEGDKNSYILKHKYTFYGEWKGDTAAGADLGRIFHNTKFQIKICGNRKTKQMIMFELSPRPVDDLGVKMYLYKINKMKKTGHTICEEVASPDDSRAFLAGGCPQLKHALSPGNYMLIPATMGPNQEREFCLRIYSNAKIVAKTVDGTCFLYKNEGSEESQEKRKIFTGNWKDLYITNNNFRTSIHTLPQYHIKTTGAVSLSVNVLHDFSGQDGLSAQIYELKNEITFPINEQNLPHSPVNSRRIMVGPQYQCAVSLQANKEYVLFPFPWESNRTRDYAIVLGLKKDDTLDCKLMS